MCVHFNLSSCTSIDAKQEGTIDSCAAGLFYRAHPSTTSVTYCSRLQENKKSITCPKADTFCELLVGQACRCIADHSLILHYIITVTKLSFNGVGRGAHIEIKSSDNTI